MAPSIPQLTWLSLTTAVNEIKSPNKFLKDLVFSNHQSLDTAQVEVDVVTRLRVTAPFVSENAEGFLVSGTSENFQVVKSPNIRIKRAFTPSELLFGRRPGTSTSPGLAGIRQAINLHVARDMQALANMVTNAEEYLASLAVQGLASYQVADGAVYQITYPKPGANNITLAVFWDDADPTNPNIDDDFQTVKQILSEAVALGVTHALMGVSASKAFRRVVKKQNPFGLLQPGAGYGNVNFQEQYNSDGAIYIGTYAGVQCWEYSRTVSVDGVSTPMIRDKYVEFLAVNPFAENTLYYGAIGDMKTFGAVPYVGERFSKSWLKEDPSAYMALLASRPLPVPRRPGSMVSMKVCA